MRDAVKGAAAMTTQLRKNGLGVLGDMPWGTHCCNFYQTQQDYLDSLTPFFKVGLEDKELCVWVRESPGESDAKARPAQSDGPGSVRAASRARAPGASKAIDEKQLRRGCTAAPVSWNWLFAATSI